MQTLKLSVVVLTKNEQDNISQCLSSVAGWADEIIVVDDESCDKTVEIAKQFTSKVFLKKMDVEGTHRNWSYKLAVNDWVLSLDADETVSDQLKKEIIDRLSTNTEFVAFSIPLRNYIGNYWVRYSGWYPAAKVRLFKKENFSYEEVKVHPRVFIKGKCGHLTKDIIHKGYPDIAHFLSSLNRQTTLEAEKWFNQNKPMRLGRFIWRSLDRFFRSYIGKKGYKDGFFGFVVAFFASLYQILSYLKYREIIHKRGPER
jgi:glycosyltransferase involved in cell wall biosynthesis